MALTEVEQTFKTLKRNVFHCKVRSSELIFGRLDAAIKVIKTKHCILWLLCYQAHSQIRH